MQASIPQLYDRDVIVFAPSLTLSQLGKSLVRKRDQQLPTFDDVAEQLDNLWSKRASSSSSSID